MGCRNYFCSPLLTVGPCFFFFFFLKLCDCVGLCNGHDLIFQYYFYFVVSGIARSF